MNQCKIDSNWKSDLDRVGRPIRTLVMVSTAGHCLNDLLFRQRSGRLPIEIVGVIGNHPDLAPLAEFYDIPFHHVPVSPETKKSSEEKIAALVSELDVELIVLARYMQILSEDLCRDLAWPRHQYPSFVPSELQRGEALPSGASTGCEDHWGHRSLRDKRSG